MGKVIKFENASKPNHETLEHSKIQNQIKYFTNEKIFDDLDQGSQTRGPPTVFLRPALLSKFKKKLHTVKLGYNELRLLTKTRL
jgi:hypothetical protein